MKRKYLVMDKERLSGAIRSIERTFGDEEYPLQISVERHKETRRIAQNRFYWALVSEIAGAWPAHNNGQWFAPECWHECFKRMFLGVETMEINGESMVIPKSSKRLSVGDFSNYSTQVQAWAIEEGLITHINGHE